MHFVCTRANNCLTSRRAHAQLSSGAFGPSASRSETAERATELIPNRRFSRRNTFREWNARKKRSTRIFRIEFNINYLVLRR